MGHVQQARFVRARRIFDSVSIVMLGSAFSRAWVRVVTPLLPAGPLFGDLSANNLFDMSGALVALCLAFVSTRIGLLHSRFRFLLMCSCAMGAATVLVWLSSGLCIQWLAVPGSVLGGAGFMVMSLAWTVFYMSFNPARMIFYYCLSQVVSNLLIFAFEGYGAPQLYCVLAVLPFVSWYTLRRSFICVESEEHTFSAPKARPFPWKLTLFLTVYTFAYSIAESSSGVLSTYPGLFLYIVPPLLFVIGVAFEPKYLSLRGVYLIVCPVMMCALLLPVALPALPGGVSAAFISLGFNASGILGVLVAGSISYRLGISALWMLGITRAFSYAGRFAGDWCYQALRLSDGGISAPLSIVLAVCVVVASMMLLTEKDVNANWHMVPPGWRAGSDTRSPGDLAANEAGTISAGPLVAISQARELYRLTAREEEILCLLAQKKTVPTIASDMFLAQGTVKAHVQHIYQKMGVHSRKELEAALGL